MTTLPASAPRTGGCLCGAIRFTVTGPPDYPHTCALDDGATRVAITLSGLGNPPDLVPVNQSHRDSAVPWPAQVSDTRHRPGPPDEVVGFPATTPAGVAEPTRRPGTAR
ncbi:hypothetical protein [Streptomyces sp. NBC_01294]|uniref:hypothetical protein n=1 Tax=Streptomyces sp. NBC_01294 TaxID=2903815 RepID=UPI002DDA8960|nr:hypothetical protein [Streptomyces sp. NBC_01294]WRZ55117.1 hypothetical protein OG534_00410 [Streptomyces sp. NBC_01294]WRZ61586.1 hypothetical protein OG534_37060 [Streptomyces sp. NBC_01294]